MSNAFFQFRQFTVYQDQCAMKVGTDGVLLGAWARLLATEGRVLDMGTGTGLLALMMAQRYPHASVTAVDIDDQAVIQAQQNIRRSPFVERITISQGDIREWEDQPFDAIVANPPYFVDSLICPDDQRTTARHTGTLTYRELMETAWHLLSDNGIFSVVIPFDYLDRLSSEAALVGFFLSRQCAVRTTPRKSPRRYLLEWVKHPCTLQRTEEVLETAPLTRSPWYQSLTHEFYIK